MAQVRYRADTLAVAVQREVQMLLSRPFAATDSTCAFNLKIFSLAADADSQHAQVHGRGLYQHQGRPRCCSADSR
jgi:hypothetical protein